MDQRGCTAGENGSIDGKTRSETLLFKRLHTQKMSIHTWVTPFKQSPFDPFEESVLTHPLPSGLPGGDETELMLRDLTQ